MKVFSLFLLVSIYLITIIGCNVNKSHTYKQEIWEMTLDNGTGISDIILQLNEDDTVTAKCEWNYTYSEYNIQCPFSNGIVNIDGINIDCAADGNASNLNQSIPAQYQMSHFIIEISGIHPFRMNILIL